MPKHDARARDRFSALFDEHHASLMAYALRRCANVGDAEDATAEVFVVAWRRIEDVPTDALPWLYGVARRTIANQHRAGLRRFALLQRLTGQRPVDGRPLGEAGGPATTALRLLSSDDQELLRLVVWEELSHTHIATMLGITPNAVAIRLHRARQRFTYALESVEGDLKGPASSRTSTPMKGTMPERSNLEDVT